MAVDDDRSLPAHDAPARADLGDPHPDDAGTLDLTTAVKDGVDRVAEKIKGLLGSNR